jgi:elongation factor 1 alpha-like protein
MTVSGRIQTGTVVVGDQVQVMPINELCTVKNLNDHRGIPCKAAVAGTNVELGLQGLDDASMLHVGCLLCDPIRPIRLVVSFEAQIQTLDTLSIPLVKGIQFTMHLHNTDVPVTVRKLIGLCDKANPGVITHKKPRRIGRNEIAKVRIEMLEGHPGICLETFEEFRALGRVLLRDNGVTVCVGFVTKLKRRRKRGR